MITLAIDAMSGDVGPDACVAGACQALREDPQLRLLLVGRPAEIEARLAGAGVDRLRDRLDLIDSPDVITMEDKPRDAIRHRKHSSMRMAIDLVKSQQAAGVVSAGNTGALTAISHFVLKCLPNVERAPIMSSLPSSHGFTHMLDLGANTQATPVQLRQFAVMGSIVARDVHGIEKPRVGLLNIGSEETKGHELVQLAHAEMRSCAGIQYLGFVEGNDIFNGRVDVVVTDGFTGNVTLKALEGLANLIRSRLKDGFTASLPAKIAGMVARPVLQGVAESLDPRRYNGAVMVGLSGVVVKSHGGADAVAFSKAIGVAKVAAARGLIRHISQAEELAV